MSHARKVFAVALVAALAWAVAPVTEAQPPIRIGASVAQTGVYAASGQNVLRGYQLCVKHLNDKGGVLGRKLELVIRRPVRAIALPDLSAPKVAMLPVKPFRNVTEGGIIAPFMM